MRDREAVFGIGSTPHIYQRFTNNRDDLLKAIAEATSVNAPQPGDVSAEIDTALRAHAYDELAVLLTFREIDQETRGNMSLKGLLAIIEGQRLAPGRKSLILFSSGFAAIPSSARITDFGTEIQAVTGVANRSGVTIYKHALGPNFIHSVWKRPDRIGLTM